MENDSGDFYLIDEFKKMKEEIHKTQGDEDEASEDDDIYGFDNPADEGGIEGLPKGLSVKNDTDTQQLDLAATYIEMGNTMDAKDILTALVKSTDSDSVREEAETLLLKTL